MVLAVTCDMRHASWVSPVLQITYSKTGHYMRQLLQFAFCTVPAADIPSLFQSALHISGTLPFPVPDVYYESQRLQDEDIKKYLAPVSQSRAIVLSSVVHAVL